MSKENLVIVHGFIQTFNYFPNFIKGLSRNYNILPIVLPGYGENYDQDINQLDEYLEFLHKKIILFFQIRKNEKLKILGWSLGGNISILLVNKYPELFSKVILLCSNPCFVKSDNNKYGMNKEIFNSFYESIQINKEKASKKFLKLQLLGVERTNFKKFYTLLEESLFKNKLPELKTLEFNLDILNKDIREVMENLKQQFIFILTENDNLVPLELVEYLKRVKKNNDKIAVIPNASHVPMLTNPDMVQFCSNLIG